MTKETPAKVLSLLMVSVMSLSFLFGVSVTNASFSGTEYPVSDPFAPEKVVAMLDRAAAGYDRFLAANLFQPVRSDLAFAADNIKWVIDESADPILAMTGLTDIASVQYYQNMDYAKNAPKVAGAYTQRGDNSGGGFGIDSLYSILIR